MSVTEARDHARELLKSTLSLGSVLAMLLTISGAVSCLAVGVWEVKDTLDKMNDSISSTQKQQTDLRTQVGDQSMQIVGVKNQVQDLSIQVHYAQNDMAHMQKQLDKIQP